MMSNYQSAAAPRPSCVNRKDDAMEFFEKQVYALNSVEAGKQRLCFLDKCKLKRAIFGKFISDFEKDKLENDEPAGKILK